MPWTPPPQVNHLNTTPGEKVKFQASSVLRNLLSTSWHKPEVCLAARQMNAGGNSTWQMPVPPVWVPKQGCSPASNPLVTVVSLQPIRCLGTIPIKRGKKKKNTACRLSGSQLESLCRRRWAGNQFLQRNPGRAKPVWAWRELKKLSGGLLLGGPDLENIRS